MSARIEQPPITPPVFIDNANQFVGINIQEPLYVLHVKAKSGNGLPFRIDASDGSGLFDIQQTATGSGSLSLKNATGSGVFVIYADNINRSFMNLQTGFHIGSNTTYPSAILSANSTDKGFLPPCMTTAQKGAISSPATGLVVFDTDLAKLCVYTGSAWETITSA